MKNYDFLVVIALQEEFDNFCTVFDVDTETQILDDINIGTLNPCKIPINSHLYYGVVLCIMDMGPNMAGIATERVLGKFNINTVINIGISGSLNKDVELCDVVIARSCIDYLYRSKIIEAKKVFNIIFGGQEIQISPSIYKKIISNKEKHKELAIENDSLQQITNNKAGIFNIHEGPIASGPSVISSNEYKNLLNLSNRNLLAVDMESSFVATAASTRTNRPILLVVRGISDYADPNKSNSDSVSNARQIAMLNASYVLKYALTNNEDFLNKEKTDSELEKSIIPNFKKLKSETFNNTHESYFKDSKLNLPLSTGSVKFTDANDFFKLIIDKKSLDEMGELSDPLENIAMFIINTNGEHPLLIKGFPGTGKSVLLRYLYIYLKTLSESTEEDLVPLYIDAQKFDKKIHQNKISNYIDQAKSRISLDLIPISNIVKHYKNAKIICIIDGVEENNIIKYEIEKVIFDTIKTAKHKKVIGIGISDFDLGKRDLNSYGNPILELVTNRILVTNIKRNYSA